MTLDQVMYGDSPDPETSGFILLAHSQHVKESDLSEIERKVNVGQWLASQQRPFVHYEPARTAV